MTFLERVKKEHPEALSVEFECGVKGCPSSYGYEPMASDEFCNGRNCVECWDREETSNVNHPSHYQGKNECIDVMLAMFGKEAVKHFCMCNAYKYRFRAGRKDGNSAEQDIEKAEWYESKLIELQKGE